MSWSSISSGEEEGLPPSPQYTPNERDEETPGSKRLHHQIENDRNEDEEDDEDDDEMFDRYLKKKQEDKVMKFLRCKDSILQPEAAVNADVFLHELRKPKEELISVFSESYVGYPTICHVLGDFIVMMEEMKKVRPDNSSSSNSKSTNVDIEDKAANSRVEALFYDFLVTEFSDKFTKGKAEELYASLNSTLPNWLQEVLKDASIQKKIAELKKTFPSSKFLIYCSQHIESIGGVIDANKRDLASLLNEDDSDDN